MNRDYFWPPGKSIDDGQALSVALVRRKSFYDIDVYSTKFWNFIRNTYYASFVMPMNFDALAVEALVNPVLDIFLHEGPHEALRDLALRFLDSWMREAMYGVKYALA